MGIAQEIRPDLQLKILESGKSNGRNGKAGKRNENLLLVDVLRAKSREREKRRARESHVIEQRGKKNNFEHSRRERGRQGMTVSRSDFIPDFPKIVEKLMPLKFKSWISGAREQQSKCSMTHFSP